VTTPTAESSDRIEEHDGDVTYIRTDKDLPPVAIIDRSPITSRHKIIFGIIAVLGAIAWAMIAFLRGETVSAVWFVIAAICTYVVAFRFYARLIEMKIVRPRDDHATPAEVFENDTDYMPTDRRVLFGHHFAAIAGAGPLVGRVTCRAPSGSSSAPCSPAACRTSWCCRSPLGVVAARWARWHARSWAPSAAPQPLSASW
jgi:carbon starvation protein